MKRKIIFLITKAGVLILILWLLFGICFSIFQNNDEEMKPAIRQGDLIVSYQLNKYYVFHDLVAIVQDGKKQGGQALHVVLQLCLYAGRSKAAGRKGKGGI